MEEQKVTGRELRLRDRVRTHTGPYSTATVVKIEDSMVHMVRPYIHTSDFETTAGVIPYIGWENYVIWMDSEVTLLERGKPPV